VARAFGASGMYYSGDYDASLEQSIKKVTMMWGGNFQLLYVKDPVKLVRSWLDKGSVIHLTMYGINISKMENEIENLREPILIIVGSSKVPKIFYQLATFNIAIGHQPHSEVAALAIFLDRLYKGNELSLRFNDAKIEVIPMARGKRIVKKNIY